MPAVTKFEAGRQRDRCSRATRPHFHRDEFVDTSVAKAAREVAFSEIVEQLPTGVDARGVERPVQGSVTSPAPRQRSTPASWDFIAAYPTP